MSAYRGQVDMLRSLGQGHVCVSRSSWYVEVTRSRSCLCIVLAEKQSYCCELLTQRDRAKDRDRQTHRQTHRQRERLTRLFLMSLGSMPGRLRFISGRTWSLPSGYQTDTKRQTDTQTDRQTHRQRERLTRLFLMSLGSMPGRLRFISGRTWSLPSGYQRGLVNIDLTTDTVHWRHATRRCGSVRVSSAGYVLATTTTLVVVVALVVVKLYRYCPRVTSPLGELNARGVAKRSDFGPIKGYISETVQDRS